MGPFLSLAPYKVQCTVCVVRKIAKWWANHAIALFLTTLANYAHIRHTWRHTLVLPS